jgi:D-alanyl-D-alanine carboxypeptidase
MNDNTDYIITTDELNETKKEPPRFPVVAQLSILGFIIFSIFGFSLFSLLTTSGTQTEDTVPTSPLVIAATSSDLATAAKMSDVTIRGTAAFVYDVKAKRVLYQKNPDQVVPLASITKLMTALLTHELVADNTRIVIPKSAVFQSGESGLREGDTLTTQALVDYSMLSSSNDAAFALAAAVGAVLEPDSHEYEYSGD